MAKESLELTDVPTLCDNDSASHIWHRFRIILLKSPKSPLNLWRSLYLLVFYEWYAQGCFQFFGSSAAYLSPLALERIILHISHDGNDDDDVKTLIPIDIKMAIFMLFIGPMICAVCNGQNYVRGR
jgi:hypothetical protein